MSAPRNAYIKSILFLPDQGNRIEIFCRKCKAILNYVSSSFFLEKEKVPLAALTAQPSYSAGQVVLWEFQHELDSHEKAEPDLRDYFITSNKSCKILFTNRLKQNLLLHYYLDELDIEADEMGIETVSEGGLSRRLSISMETAYEGHAYWLYTDTIPDDPVVTESELSFSSKDHSPGNALRGSRESGIFTGIRKWLSLYHHYDSKSPPRKYLHYFAPT